MRLFVVSLDSVAPVEAVDTSGCVNKLLLSRIERMAGRTDFNMDVGHGRACLYHIAADTCDFCKFVVRMNSFFHISPMWFARLCGAYSKHSHKSAYNISPVILSEKHLSFNSITQISAQFQSIAAEPVFMEARKASFVFVFFIRSSSSSRISVSSIGFRTLRSTQSF